jgi:hypothetical protein
MLQDPIAIEVSLYKVWKLHNFLTCDLFETIWWGFDSVASADYFPTKFRSWAYVSGAISRLQDFIITGCYV